MKEIHREVLIKLKANSEENKINRKKAIGILGLIHLPKKVRKNILKDMEEIGYIKKINKYSFEIK